MTEAERLTEFAQEHFPGIVAGAFDPADVGRLLVAGSLAGPPLWTGLRILRALGALIDYEPGERPN